jgi:hypothetical protein
VCQLLVGTGWSPILARARLALDYVGDVYVLSFLFVSRALLASLYTSLFYVHLCKLAANFRREERQRLEQAKMEKDFLKIKGMWTVFDMCERKRYCILTTSPCPFAERGCLVHALVIPGSFNAALGVPVVLAAACVGQALLKEQINECMNEGAAIAPRGFGVPDTSGADILPRRHNRNRKGQRRLPRLERAGAGKVAQGFQACADPASQESPRRILLEVVEALGMKAQSINMVKACFVWTAFAARPGSSGCVSFANSVSRLYVPYGSEQTSVRACLR